MLPPNAQPTRRLADGQAERRLAGSRALHVVENQANLVGSGREPVLVARVGVRVDPSRSDQLTLPWRELDLARRQVRTTRSGQTRPARLIAAESRELRSVAGVRVGEGLRLRLAVLRPQSEAHLTAGLAEDGLGPTVVGLHAQHHVAALPDRPVRNGCIGSAPVRRNGWLACVDRARDRADVRREGASSAETRP